MTSYPNLFQVSIPSSLRKRLNFAIGQAGPTCLPCPKIMSWPLLWHVSISKPQALLTWFFFNSINLMARNKWPKIKAKCTSQFHLTLVQTWLIILISTSDAPQSEYEFQHTKLPNSFILVHFIHKHFINDIDALIKVIMQSKTPHKAKPDPMCKSRIFSKWQKSTFATGQFFTLACSKSMLGTKTNLPAM